MQPADARKIQVKLFELMVDFHLGPMVDKKISKQMLKVRETTEKRIEKAQGGITKVKADMKEYARAFNKITKRFQDDMANLLSKDAYEALFGLQRDRRIMLADPDILFKEYKVDLKY